jgi:hypothetical protein
LRRNFSGISSVNIKADRMNETLYEGMNGRLKTRLLEANGNQEKLANKTNSHSEALNDVISNT